MNAFALLVSLVAVTGPSGRMDRSISGKVVTEYHQSLYDAKQGLYLHSSGECDGAHKRLVLTKDLRSILVNEGSIHLGLTSQEIAERMKSGVSSIQPGTINAETDKGIRLGMSPAEVQKVLGKPAKSIWSKKFQAKEMIYSHETPKDKDGLSTRYTNYYLFRAGKLYFIELAEDAIGGGC